MTIQNNTVFITGGGSGIGLALAQALIQAGNTVIICGRSAQKLEEAKQQNPALQTIVCDVANPHEVDELMRNHAALLESVNVLVNNAGVMNVYEIANTDATLERMESEVSTNLLAPIRLTKHFLPILQSKKEAAIINVTSGVAYLPMAAAPIYSATKAALHSLSLSLRHQLRDTTVRVFEVLPPLVDTAMPGALKGEGKSMKKVSPESVASEIVRGLQKNIEEMRIGDNALLYWANRFVPSIAAAQLNKM
ncbi:MAG: SDR family oxidoreductase [Candidatus Kapabacteria bacterium]|jgi:uncharacterized oxidoreductase|nr:SDR family oxidoreductase [Candidatus Kapabacteria bacterium]